VISPNFLEQGDVGSSARVGRVRCWADTLAECTGARREPIGHGAEAGRVGQVNQRTPCLYQQFCAHIAPHGHCLCAHRLPPCLPVLLAISPHAHGASILVLNLTEPIGRGSACTQLHRPAQRPVSTSRVALQPCLT
jgi:hypothetical protein